MTRSVLVVTLLAASLLGACMSRSDARRPAVPAPASPVILGVT